MARRIKENPAQVELALNRPITEFPIIGRCAVCKKKQYDTPSGASCGEHGGADTLPLLKTRAEHMAEKEPYRAVGVDLSYGEDATVVTTFEPDLDGGVRIVEQKVFDACAESKRLLAMARDGVSITLSVRGGASIELLAVGWAAWDGPVLGKRPAIFVRTIEEACNIITKFEAIHRKDPEQAKTYLVEMGVTSEGARSLRAIHREGAKDPGGPLDGRKRR